MSPARDMLHNGRDGTARSGVYSGTGHSGAIGRAVRIASTSLMALGMVLLAGAAAAQVGDARALAERLERLERDLSSLQRQVYRGSPPPSPSVAPPAVRASPGDPAYQGQTEVRLQQMSDEIRDVRGQLERVSHAVEQVRQRLDKLVDDVDYRLSALEQGGRAQSAPGAGAAAAAEPPRQTQGQAPAGPAGPAPQRPTGGQQTAAVPTGSPIEQYNSARALLAQNRYDDAERSFRTFLDQHPKHALSENAQYWLGETYYVRKKYQEAATEFFDGFSKHPKGAKAPDNLLKLSRSLAALDKGREACAALDRLVREFPDADEQVRRRAAIDRERLGCR